MLPHSPASRLTQPSFWFSLLLPLVGIVVGLIIGVKPLLLVPLAILLIGALCCWFSFEWTVLGLLVLRSSLDVLSDYQIPALFAIALDGLVIGYLSLLILLRQPIRTDWFFWVFAGWIGLEGMWVALSFIDGLGFPKSLAFGLGLREWIRMASWMMVYLLVLQLQQRFTPQRLITLLFSSLVIPLSVALMQLIVPHSLLPPILQGFTYVGTGPTEEISYRVNSTLGHPNTFNTFVLFFIALTCWQLRRTPSSQRWPWFVLLGLLALMFVSTKSLFGLGMLTLFLLVMLAPRLNLGSILGGIVLLGLVLGLYLSTDVGQERLSSITNTPLLNPEIDVSRAILLSESDQNSFNWRLSQWNYLLTAWREHPWLGYGLGTCGFFPPNYNHAHNDYVRPLVEGGILGFGAFITFLGFQATRLMQLVFHTQHSDPAQRDLSWLLFAFFLALLLGMCTENIWTHTTLFFYWYTLLAIAGWHWLGTPPQLEDNPAVAANSASNP